MIHRPVISIIVPGGSLAISLTSSVIVGGSPAISQIGDIAGRFLVISSTPAITSGLVISLRLVISPAGSVISLSMSITNVW